MPKNLLDLELVKKALAKKQVDTGIYDHYLPGAICEVTGELYSRGDVSNFPTVEALRTQTERYVTFLKEILDEYKFSPLDAEIDIYYSDGKKYGTFATCYLSCENNLGLNFEYDGRLGNILNLYIENIYFSQDSSEKALEIAQKIEKFFKDFREDILNNDEEMHIKLLYNNNGRVEWRFLSLSQKSRRHF